MSLSCLYSGFSSSPGPWTRKSSFAPQWITIAEHIPSSSGRFDLEDKFDAMENEFDEMMNFELPRQSPRLSFADESHQSDMLMLPKGHVLQIIKKRCLH